MSEKPTSSGVAASTREIVIIVLGVLIALAADSAWNSWQDRELERAYLLTLAADLDAAEERVYASMQDDSANRERASDTYDLLSGGRDLLPDSTQSLAGLGYSEFSPHVTTLDVLIETGDLSLLHSTDLRAQVINLRNRLQVTERWLDRTETQIWAAHGNRTLSLEALGPAATDLSAQRQSAALRAVYFEVSTALANRLGALNALLPSLQRTRGLLRDMGY